MLRLLLVLSFLSLGGCQALPVATAVLGFGSGLWKAKQDYQEVLDKKKAEETDGI